MARKSQSVYKQRILEVLVHIQRRLNEPLSLEELAGVAHFSPYHFHHIFKAMVGESVMGHIRRLRLEWAAQRLALTDQPVTAIALEAGYESHEGFTRAFRTMFDRSPSELRARVREELQASAPSSVHYEGGEEMSDFQPPRADTPAEGEVRIEMRQSVRVAFARHVGPYEQCGTAWDTLTAWAGPRGLLGPQTVCLGLAYDDPEVTPADRIRYDACISVPDSVEAAGEIGIQRIDGGPYAVLTHRGSYETVQPSIERLYTWVALNDRPLRPQPMVMHYTNIVQRPAPEHLVIDLCLPLETQW